MVDAIKHAFVSAKTNSVDATLVSSNAWNDGHALAGGINGQLLMYDNTQENNGKYVDGPLITSGAFSSGATSSPYTASAFTVNLGTPTFALVMPNVYVITSGGAAYTMDVLINSVLFIQIQNVGSGIQFTYPHLAQLNAGSVNITVRLTASAGTFTSITGNVYMLTIGRL